MCIQTSLQASDKVVSTVDAAFECDVFGEGSHGKNRRSHLRLECCQASSALFFWLIGYRHYCCTTWMLFFFYIGAPSAAVES